MDFFSVLPQQPFLRITSNTYNVSSKNGKIVNVILMVNLNIWIKEKMLYIKPIFMRYYYLGCLTKICVEKLLKIVIY